jgi:hypothetical protein
LVSLKSTKDEVFCYILALSYDNAFQDTSSLPLKANFQGIFIKESNKIESIELRSINEEHAVLIDCIPA